MGCFLLLGLSTGLRALTGVAVMCWFAYLGRTPLHGWAFWAGYLVSVIVFSVMALGEYVGDTLPSTPNRTAAGPAVSRLVLGGLAGALGANAVHQPAVGGVILGLLGAAIGTWGGFRVRARLARALGSDLPAALLESALALGVALFAAHELSIGVMKDAAWWTRHLS